MCVCLPSGFSNNNKINLGQEKQIKAAFRADHKAGQAASVSASESVSEAIAGDNDRDGNVCSGGRKGAR